MTRTDQVRDPTILNLPSIERTMQVTSEAEKTLSNNVCLVFEKDADTNQYQLLGLKLAGI